MKGKTTYYKIINWTRISVKTKQDSRIYFESLVFYSKNHAIRNKHQCP